MKLEDVPKNTRIKVGDMELNFRHTDCMFSLSYTDDGRSVHLSRFTEVEVVEVEE